MPHSRCRAGVASALDLAVQHTSAVAIAVVFASAIIAWRTLPKQTS